ncbi:MAG TPA: hypothetical protein VFT53_00295 [Candidatus Saccharimonadales bacterium]|nr:hypothetical protein [Candidatus Saccharimonadales bacterium]
MKVTDAQKKNLLNAKVAVALQSELGRQPKTAEIEQIAMLTRVMWKTVVGLHYQRKIMKQEGQLALF